MTCRPSSTVVQQARITRWACDLDQLCPDEGAASWLTEAGLLTERVRSRCQGHFGLRIVDERHGILAAEDAEALGVADLSAFFREIELTCDDQPMVFAQTLVPDATLAAEPWLALLGNDALGPRLASLGGALREPLEFALLQPMEPLFERARPAVKRPIAALWARRACYRLATHRLIVQEVFLPDVLS